MVHSLSRVLPAAVRNLLRQAAVATIPSMRHLDMPKRLEAIARNGFSPKTIVDVGAANGEWSRMAAGLWPEARILGVEPNRYNRAALELLRREIPRFAFFQGLLGPEHVDSVRYVERENQTSLLDATDGHASSAPMLTLDELCREFDVAAVDLLKLDVQGFELEVLKGGAETLRACQAVLTEVSFIPFLPRIPLAHEVVAFMHERGFIWHDTVAILRRGSDDALLQMDLLFLKADHPLRARNDLR